MAERGVVREEVARAGREEMVGETGRGKKRERGRLGAEEMGGRDTKGAGRSREKQERM